MLKKFNLNSIHVKLNLIIFSIITLASLILTIGHVLDLKSSVENEALQNSKVNLFELKESIAPFIDSYEITDYENIIRNNIIHSKYIKAIILNDYKTGEILGENSYLVGFYKNNGDIEAINKVDMWKNNFFEEFDISLTTDIYNKKDEKIAFLKFYLSDEMINERLKKYFIDNILFLLFFYILLLLISYLLIRKYLSKPLDNIIKNLEKNRENVNLMEKLKEHGSSEFSILSRNFNSLIHKIKKSQEELNKSRLRWEFALEGGGFGVWDWNLKNNEVYFSDLWKTMLGYKPDEISNSVEEWSKRVHPDDLDEALHDVTKYIESHEGIYENQHRLLCKDGTYKWVLDRGIIVEWDEDNKPLRFIGTHTDITEIKEYELHSLEANIVFENTNDSIILTDNEKRIINVNKAFEDLTGYKKEEVLGKTPDLFNSKAQNDNYYKELWKKIEEDGSWSGNLVDTKKSGETYEVITTINSISDNKEIVYYVAIIHDITLFKKQEKIIFQQSKTAALGEMIGNIAHQWRQPLSIISTASTGLKLMLEYTDTIDKKEAIEQLKYINDTTQYLSSTIEDFKNFFKDNHSLKTNFYIDEVIDKANKLTKDSIENNFINYSQEVEKIKIEGFNTLLVQVLINIINNSVDALKESNKKDKYIFLKAYKENDKLKLEIYDNGGGIDEAIIDKIFDPYFTTKHESIGTGLGLYMSFEIIKKQFNGKIFATNVEHEFNGVLQKGAQTTIIINDIIE